MRAQLRHVALSGTLLALATTTACAHTPRARGPEAVVSDFRNALARGDTRGAYALLSAEQRQALSPHAFDQQLRENPKEASTLLSALEHLSAPRVTASLHSKGDGRAVVLIRDPKDGQFRIQSSLTDFYPRDTPRAALGSFVRAVEGSRWDVLLTLMPEADRGDLTAEALGKNLASQLEELTRIVALLKTAQDAPIEIVGKRATMPYGESYTARLVREADGWKVEDPE